MWRFLMDFLGLSSPTIFFLSSLSIQGTCKLFLLPSLHHAPLWSCAPCAISSEAGKCMVVRKKQFSGQSLNVSLSLRTIYVWLNKALGYLQEVFPAV